jgi:hypothetical protein
MNNLDSRLYNQQITVEKQLIKILERDHIEYYYFIDCRAKV